MPRKKHSTVGEVRQKAKETPYNYRRKHARYLSSSAIAEDTFLVESATFLVYEPMLISPNDRSSSNDPARSWTLRRNNWPARSRVASGVKSVPRKKSTGTQSLNTDSGLFTRARPSHPLTAMRGRQTIITVSKLDTAPKRQPVQLQEEDPFRLRAILSDRTTTADAKPAIHQERTHLHVTESKPRETRPSPPGASRTLQPRLFSIIFATNPLSSC